MASGRQQGGLQRSLRRSAQTAAERWWGRASDLKGPGRRGSRSVTHQPHSRHTAIHGSWWPPWHRSTMTALLIIHAMPAWSGPDLLPCCAPRPYWPAGPTCVISLDRLVPLLQAEIGSAQAGVALAPVRLERHTLHRTHTVPTVRCEGHSRGQARMLMLVSGQHCACFDSRGVNCTQTTYLPCVVQRPVIVLQARLHDA